MAFELNEVFVIKSETLDNPLSEHNNELHEEIKIKKEPFEEHDTEFDSSETFGQNTILSGNEMDTDNTEFGVEDVKPFEVVEVKMEESFLAEPVTDNSLTCEKCNATFTSQLNLNDHVCKTKRIETFTCNLCSNKFVTRDFLQRHLLKEHKIDENSATSLLPPPTLNFCEICCLSYNSNDALQHNLQFCYQRIVHQSFKCTDCGIDFRLKSVLERHMNIVHGVNTSNDNSILQNLLIKPPRNPSTDTKCKSSTSFEQNVSTVCKDLGQFKCTKCQKYFKSHASLIVHLLTHNNTKPLEDARETNLINIDKTTLESNAMIDIKSESFDTEIDSNETFGQNTNLSEDEMDTDNFEIGMEYVKPFEIVESLLAEPDNSFTCGKCNETFMNKSSFDDHCNECLAQINSLVRQGLTDNSNKKHYYCEICGKRFNFSNLKLHLIVSHKLIDTVLINKLLSRVVQPKEHICEICSKTYSSAYALREHKHSIHQSVKPYICTICEVCFTFENSLKRHLLLHENFKSYKCSKCCVKRFTSKFYLKQHVIKVHGKRRYKGRRHGPFKCDICNGCFVTKNGLKVHSTLHSGEKPYMCSICGKHYRLNSNLKHHLLRVHDLNDKKTIKNFILKSLEKPSIDKVCDIESKSSRSLKNHINIVHKDVRQFKCSTCHEDFTSRTSIIDHLRTHENTELNFTSGLQHSSPKLHQSMARNKVRQPDCKLTSSSLPEMWITKVKPCCVMLDRGEVTRYLSRLDKREVTEERGSPIEGLPPPLATPAPPVRDDPSHPCGAVSVTSDLLLGAATSTLENIM